MYPTMIATLAIILLVQQLYIIGQSRKHTRRVDGLLNRLMSQSLSELADAEDLMKQTPRDQRKRVSLENENAIIAQGIEDKKSGEYGKGEYPVI